MESEVTYGVVAIIGGKYAGRLGYLDDDETENGEECGIVYLSTPMDTPYVVIPVRHLRQATDEEERAWVEKTPAPTYTGPATEGSN